MAFSERKISADEFLSKLNGDYGECSDMTGNVTHRHSQCPSVLSVKLKRYVLADISSFHGREKVCSVQYFLCVPHFCTMDDELLIELVRERQILYNLKDPKYLNADWKGRIWQEIGLKMNVDGEFLNLLSYIIYFIFTKYKNIIRNSKYIIKTRSTDKQLTNFQVRT